MISGPEVDPNLDTELSLSRRKTLRERKEEDHKIRKQLLLLGISISVLLLITTREGYMIHEICGINIRKVNISRLKQE